MVVIEKSPRRNKRQPAYYRAKAPASDGKGSVWAEDLRPEKALEQLRESHPHTVEMPVEFEGVRVQA